MELTEPQRRVVDHAGGTMRLAGGPGTGKSTALEARYVALALRHRASTVLFLCPSRQAARRMRERVLPHLAGGFDSLPITTFAGLAHDVVTRADGPVRLVTGAEQRRIVARLLAEEAPSAWPTLGHLLRRPALVKEVADGLLLLQQQGDGPSRQAGPAWAELAQFLPRYADALATTGRLDVAGLLSRAAQLLPDVGAGATALFAHVLVDDVEAADPAALRMLGALAGGAEDCVVAGDVTAPLLPGVADVDLGRCSLRDPAPPLLVTCPHPSVEVEAIAAELLAAHERGVAWGDMAVLVPRLHPRARRISRGLARHGIPAAAPTLPVARDDPVVSSIVDMLRWLAGDAAALDRLLVSPLSRLDPLEARQIRRRALAGETSLEADAALAPLVALRDSLATRVAATPPAELAFDIWRDGLGHLVGEEGADDSLDAVVAFLDALNRDAEQDPSQRLADVVATLDLTGPDEDAFRLRDPAAAEAVTVSSILGAGGREWHTVVLAGCVEGELPRASARAPVFDPAMLAGRPPLTAAERRREALAGERRLFRLACSRATSRLVGVAAPEPGVLLSRFVEAWASGVARVLEPSAKAPPPPAPTVSGVPIVSGGGLVLSATQLDTYDDCPLRYAYRYVVRARDEAGVRADLGSRVHEVLRRFLDPAGDVPRTRDALLALGRQSWRDDIARYRPQVEEARRDYFAMLESWWEAEGEGPLAPVVLAVEHPFDIEVGGHRLVGAIDRIDRTTRSDGSHGIRILDYKTGKAEPTQAQVASNLQLAVYHLAATRDPELAALGPPTELRLLFLRSMRCYDQEVVAGLAAATEARIVDVAERIRAEELEPSVDANCRWCTFQRLCPIQAQGRQLGDTGTGG